MKQKNGLEIDHDVAYHRRFWRVQRTGWVAWALILIAAVVGLVGPGIKGKETVRNSGLSLTFERFVHHQSPTEWEIRLAPATRNNSETRLALNRACIEAIDANAIHPEPEKQESSGEEIIYTFNREKPQEPMTIVFRYEARSLGEIPIQLRVEENPAIFVKQFSFP